MTVTPPAPPTPQATPGASPGHASKAASPDALSRFVSADAPDSGELGLCVHCGFCLNACPTYLELGVETESPRGRLYLMRALDEGRIDLTPRVQKHFDRCLQCRACETACPSNVPFGRLMERTRADIFQQKKSKPPQRLLWRSVMRGVFPHPQRLRAVGLGLRVFQASGLQSAVRSSGLLDRFAPALADMDALAPDFTKPFFRPQDAKQYRPVGQARARVAFLTGCIMPLTFGETHHATLRVLARNNIDVIAPEDQVCCGALHAHSGDAAEARRLARKNIDRFLRLDPEAILVNSAGCGSHMKEYSHLLRNDHAYREKAARFDSLVKDIHEYLIDVGFDTPTGDLGKSVTYQDSCHLVHAQQVTDAPRAILRQIPGLELREMAHPDRCCGSAGLYSVVQKDLSRQLLENKMEEINATGADVVCTANPGCMVQLDAGLRLFAPPSGPLQRGQRAAAPPATNSVHAIQLLDQSYAIAEGPDYATPRAQARRAAHTMPTVTLETGGRPGDAAAAAPVPPPLEPPAFLKKPPTRDNGHGAR